MLDACRALPAACLFDGDEIWTGNSTEGGEVPVLYYLKVLLHHLSTSPPHLLITSSSPTHLSHHQALQSDAALPHSVCPYTPVAGHDRECKGLAEARATSPLKFEVSTLLYEGPSHDTSHMRGYIASPHIPLEPPSLPVPGRLYEHLLRPVRHQARFKQRPRARPLHHYGRPRLLYPMYRRDEGGAAVRPA